MSTPSTVTITVKCPVESCAKEKEINVPQFLFDNKRSGMIKIPIHKDICCDHEFIAFISKDGYKIRGYEKIDTVVDLSKLHALQAEKIYIENLLSKYGSLATSAILHALILVKPIIILRSNEEKNLASKIVNLLIRFLPDDFNDQIISLNHLLISDYKKAKIGKSLVISQTGLIANTPWQNISDKFERNLINHAITIIDPESQAILIQNELGQILNQASYIVRVIEEGEIFEDDLKKKLNDKFNISISNVDLKYLKQIVSERFGKNTKRIKNRSLSKLKEGLW